MPDLLLEEERAGLEAGRHLLVEGRRARLARAKAAGSTARDLMTSPAVTVAPEAPLAEAARRQPRRPAECLRALRPP